MKKEKLEKNKNVLEQNLVNNYQKEIFDILTISGTNENNMQCVFYIPKNQMFLEKEIKMDHFSFDIENKDDNYNKEVRSAFLLSMEYGFDSLRETLRYNVSHEKNQHTRVVLFNAFDLKSIQIPEEVEELELYGCPNLEEITLPDSLEKLSIIKCKKLNNIHIPDNVHTLRLSKNKFKNDFNIPIHCMNLTVDINMLDDEALYYIDNKYVNVNLVAENFTLGI